MTREALQNHCTLIEIRLDKLHVRWVYFQEKYHNSQKYVCPPLFEEILKFIAHGHIYCNLHELPYDSTNELYNDNSYYYIP